jgi:hypothetical protein
MAHDIMYMVYLIWNENKPIHISLHDWEIFMKDKLQRLMIGQWYDLERTGKLTDLASLKTGVLFEFPIVADIDMSVSRLYGMLQPGESETAAVRAVFIMDPEGKVRLIMYYPLNVGRNMEEIKRALVALQTSDQHKCAMPLNWTPGEKVIVPAPKTVEALQERKNSDLEMVDWYLAKRSLT